MITVKLIVYVQLQPANRIVGIAKIKRKATYIKLSRKRNRRENLQQRIFGGKKIVVCVALVLFPLWTFKCDINDGRLR